MAVATPYIATNPYITINGTIDLVCHARTVRLTAEDNEVDVDTFCNADGVAYGTTKWVFETDALQSFGTGGTPGIWSLLYPLRKTTATFVVKPLNAANSTSNPQATFTAWIPTVPFLDSDRGDSTVMTLTFPLVGEPVFVFV